MAKQIEFEGVIYKSHKALCEAHGVKVSTFRPRKSKGYTLRECIYGRVKSVEYNEKQYPTYKDLAKEFNIEYSTLIGRLNSGFSLKDSIENNLNGKNKIEYNGITYSSEAEFCRANGISESTYHHRKTRGLSIEECMKKIENIEYEGKIYNNYKQLADEYKLNYEAFIKRLSGRNTSLDDAVKGYSVKYNKVEFEGITYKTEKLMCESLGIDYGKYKNRKKGGWTLEERIYGKRR